MADGSRSSHSTISVPQYLRWLLPSVADLIFIALLASLLFTPLAVRLLGDAGIGWHIRAGQQILATHAVPRVDPFSSTMSGKPWFAWEWLYDLVVGKLETSFGLNGVVWLTAVVIAATFGGLFRFLMGHRTDLVVGLVLVLLAISASMIHLLARPHVVSWMLTVAWLAILDSGEWSGFPSRSEQNRRWLWLLPVLMVIWVNVHGGFMFGLALLAIDWMGAMWAWLRTRSDRLEDLLEREFARRRARELTLVGLVSAVASLANPYGWRLHEHIYSYLTNRFLMNHIEEFQSPNFHGVAQQCFLALLLLVIAAVVSCRNEVRLVRILLLLFAVYAGLDASRNIPIASIVLVVVAGPLLKIEWEFARRMSSVESKLRGHLWPMAATIFALLVVANGGRLASQQLMDAHFDPGRMPVHAVDYLAAHQVQGPILGPDFWGGYLIYRLYPHAQVVVDDRHDLYGAEFFESYLKMVHVEDGWQEFLQATHPACVLLPRNTALASMLLQSSAWSVTYQDDAAIVFVPEAKH